MPKGGGTLRSTLRSRRLTSRCSSLRPRSPRESTSDLELGRQLPYFSFEKYFWPAVLCVSSVRHRTCPSLFLHNRRIMGDAIPILLLFAVSVYARSAGNQWSQWRGPNRDASSRGPRQRPNGRRRLLGVGVSGRRRLSRRSYRDAWFVTAEKIQRDRDRDRSPPRQRSCSSNTTAAYQKIIRGQRGKGPKATPLVHGRPGVNLRARQGPGGMPQRQKSCEAESPSRSISRSSSAMPADSPVSRTDSSSCRSLRHHGGGFCLSSGNGGRKGNGKAPARLSLAVS